MLYERYEEISDLYEELGIKIPDYIIENLRYSLRHYQEDGIRNFIYWETKDKKRLSENHVLFQMATGTGKTLMMASLILYLYNKGYRKFIFFVNSTTILEKTKENFINSQSSKYLFKEKININGKNVEIKPINNLDQADEDNINILFTTIQGIHITLNKEKEDSITFEDFEKHKVVFLSDEAHHNNTQSIQKEIELEKSWETTIKNSFEKNKENYLLEFTATAKLEKKEIRDKYEQKIIYNYNFTSFRKDGYSKDVRLINTNLLKEERILLSIIINEYRRFIAGIFKLDIKPILLFKSSKIQESSENLDLFRNIVENISIEDLNNISKNLEKEINNIFLKEIKEFIDSNIDYLLRSIPIEFHEEKILKIDSDKTGGDKEKKQNLLNSLEDKENKIRVIFAVDALNEGWDVLNLFDIVKLYETKNTNTVTKEVQLIGRGARYFPFILEGENDIEMKYKRKYDKTIEDFSLLKILEQLHYHSLQDVKFISELEKEMKEKGIIENKLKEVKINIKEEFKSTEFYKNGHVYSNSKEKLEPKFRSFKRDLQLKIHQEIKYLEIPIETEILDLTKNIKEHSLEDVKIDSNIKNNRNISLEYIDDRLFYKAVSKIDFFTLESIDKYVEGGLNSIKDLKKIFNKSSITIYYKGDLEQYKIEKYLLDSLINLLLKIKEKMNVNNVRYIGTRHFKPSNIKEIFKNIKKVVPSEQKDSLYLENTNDIKYFVQDSFYGDSSYEKEVITVLNDYFNEDKNKTIYKDVYMIRNYGQLKLYNFEDGRGFEPDFILFLKMNNKEITYQLFVEPKGEHIKEYDKWKENFLEELCQIDNSNNIILEGFKDKYKIVGLPFYDMKKEYNFFESLEKKLKKRD